MEMSDRLCGWSRQDDDETVWDTGCGKCFYFEAGAPAEDGFNFCPYCGKKIDASQEDGDV